MKSSYADYFNHDEDAADYDTDVLKESHPVRTGYASLLSWIGRQVKPETHVLDLGSGTGNTILALPKSCKITAVDISKKMTAIAKAKTVGRSVSFCIQDVAEYISVNPLGSFDFIVSSYVLHHLIPEERKWLFSELYKSCNSGIQIFIGDLMYENEKDKKRIIEKYEKEFPDVIAGFSDEFYWDVSQSEKMLTSLGWDIEIMRFSDLSWGFSMGRTRK